MKIGSRFLCLNFLLYDFTLTPLLLTDVVRRRTSS